jgi:DHA1 family tetracycline resistance protein-like MFS transporter
MTQTFFFFTKTDSAVFLPGAPFLLSAVLVIGAIIVFLPLRKKPI